MAPRCFRDKNKKNYKNENENDTEPLIPENDKSRDKVILEKNNRYPTPENPPKQECMVDKPIEFPREPRYDLIPIALTCPYCKKQVVTKTNYITGLLTWIMCIVLICFGCILGCCLIPFHVDALKDVEHICPNCDRTLHVYDRIRGR